ncbi:MAG: PD-(D/E)XK nuclease family protein [Cellvibrionaceae bacterium]
MPISLFNIQPLLPAISENSLILTPNSRLRNKLTDAYNRHALSLGEKSSWTAPRVYSLAEWVLEQYQLLLDRASTKEARALIDDFAERQLWLNIVEENSAGAELINPVKLAADAQSAYKTLKRWNLDPCNIDSSQEYALETWSKSFEDQLRTFGFTTSEHIQQDICEALTHDSALTEARLTLVGFDDITPLTQRLFDAISDQQNIVDPLAKRNGETNTKVRSYNSSEEEITAAARWALAKLSHNPDAVIGIISPELGQNRQQIERLFVEIFEPHFALPETARYTMPFNFSAGIPLGSTSFIRDTLALLNLNAYQNSVEFFDNLLFSPFFAIPPRLALKTSQTLSTVFRSTLKTSRLRQLVHRQSQSEDISGEETETWSRLDAQLQDIKSLKRQRPNTMLASGWAELFEQQLRKLGWPGERRLDSNEYQQMNQWYELLEKFAFLDQLQTSLTCSQALDQLTKLASGVHFQPQTPESPIQILGALEGSGLQFTDCWVLGLSQQSWPPAAEPNPLIPLQLQRALAMPHADADRELAYAEHLTQGYKRCANDIVFSYPKMADATPLHKSPLLEGIAEQGDTTETSTTLEWGGYLETFDRALEWVNVGMGPSVSEEELKSIRGGSQIFKNQAISPFAAFALHRLKAKTKQTIAAGFTAIQRGEILHGALSDIWKSLESQAQLLETSDNQLQSLIHDCVEQQVKHFAKKEPEAFGNNYVQLEIARQSKLIERWLDNEKQRHGFSVAANEESVKVEFAGLPLNLRLDRMDKLDSGELVLIDYKTGNPNPKSWGSERPEEPQLPLYCLCYNQDIDAVLFAQVNTRDIAVKGLGELSEPMNGVISSGKAGALELPETWEDIQAHWKTSLEKLAREFLEGDCSLEFKSLTTKRFYQDLEPIMRWREEKEIVDAFTSTSAAEDKY